MIEIFKKNNLINIKNSNNTIVSLNIENEEVKIWDYIIDSPWEYEKSEILLEVMEYSNKLFYNFLIEWKVIFILFHDNFEQKEEIMSFFWDIDILLIIWTKNSTKIIENIEAKIVIPFGEWKNLFLNTISQYKEELEVFKLKWDIWNENTEFINLK